MPFSTRWSRRRFLHGAGQFSAIRLAAAAFPPHFPLSSTSNIIQSKFTYVGSIPENGPQGIYVFAVDGLKWSQLQFIGSAAPVSLCLHPLQNVMYVANRIDNDRGMPCGTVEAFAIESRTGKLSLLCRQRLSLSGINPQHIAISPDGCTLAVAICGGAYNLIPLDKNGVPEGVSAIFKEAACGPHPDLQKSARPRFIAFDSENGKILATDTGCDRISVFADENHSLNRRQKVDTVAASGPGPIVINYAVGKLYLLNELNGSLSSHSYAPQQGLIGNRIQNFAMHDRRAAEGHSAIAVHPSKRFLYASFVNKSSEGHVTGCISVFEISSVGCLIPRQTLDNVSMHEILIDKSGTAIFAADPTRNQILCAPIDQQNGELRKPFPCASIEKPMSLMLKDA
jgi:6-phosphogluconolactonase (cycloisomerase 2 family)